MKAMRGWLLLPAALACLSASSSIGFRWYLGPVVDGRPCEIKVCFSEEQYPNAYGYADAWGEESGHLWRYVDFEPMANLPRDKQGYRTYVCTIPAVCMRKDEVVNFTFGISTEAYYTGMDFSKLRLRVKEVVRVQPETGLMVFGDNEIREMNRDLFAYDPSVDQWERKIYRDAYETMGIAFGRTLSSRRVPFNDLKILYSNPYLAPLAKPEAELRLLSLQEEFASIATLHGGYSAIPLKVTILKGMGGNYRYVFSLSRSYFYSRIDGKAYEEAPVGEPCFESANLFLPLREGDDDALFEYQIAATGLGAYGDEAILRSSALSSRKFFGPCIEAEYCLLGGRA